MHRTTITPMMSSATPGIICSVKPMILSNRNRNKQMYTKTASMVFPLLPEFLPRLTMPRILSSRSLSARLAYIIHYRKDDGQACVRANGGREFLRIRFAFTVCACCWALNQITRRQNKLRSFGNLPAGISEVNVGAVKECIAAGAAGCPQQDILGACCGENPRL